MSELWLSLDLTWPKGTLAVHRCDGGTLIMLGETLVSDTFDHSEKLIPALDATLKRAGVPLSAIDRYVAPSGPGSFTGLRIAMISLKAFAQVWNRPVDTVSGAEARAHAWLSKNAKKPTDLLVVTQTTRVLAHCATFDEPNNWKCREEKMVESEALLREVKPTQHVLLDESFAPEGLPDHMTRFPLQARYLADCLLTAKSRKGHQSFESLVALSPEYFGSSRFDV